MSGRFSIDVGVGAQSRPLGEDGWFFTCTVCGSEGELMMCEYNVNSDDPDAMAVCPHVYHAPCLGLSTVPEGTFICPRHSDATVAMEALPLNVQQCIIYGDVVEVKEDDRQIPSAGSVCKVVAAENGLKAAVSWSGGWDDVCTACDQPEPQLQCMWCLAPEFQNGPAVCPQAFHRRCIGFYGDGTFICPFHDGCTVSEETIPVESRERLRALLETSQVGRSTLL